MGRFLGKFVLAYGLLIAPWPGWNATYARCFRSAGNLVFTRESGRRLLRFEAVPVSMRHSLDTRIFLANREAVGEDGNTPVKYLELDTRAIGWIPTALLLALGISTPLSWRLKIRVLLCATAAIHAFILFSLAIYIWNNSTDLGIVTLSPLAKNVAGGLEETLIAQLGASFVVPGLIWAVALQAFAITPRGSLDRVWFSNEKVFVKSSGTNS